jgi:hypothetical protein
VHKKRLLISDTLEHVDSENQFLKNRDFFFINVAKIGKNGPKMEFFDFFEISHFLM